MPKIGGNQIAPGAVIEHNGAFWFAAKTNPVKPGKGGAFNQMHKSRAISINTRRADQRS